MRFLVEKTNVWTEHPHLHDEERECATATEAGIQMEDLAPVDAADITECLWRGEDPIRDFNDENGDEVVVTRIDEPKKLRVTFTARDLLRGLRRVQGDLAPGWLDTDPPRFVFPGWGPAWRPFDWAVDS